MVVETFEDSYPLSPMQQGMLFHSIAAQQSGVNIEQIIVAVHENLQVSAFKQAWQRVVERHPVLRTSFDWQGNCEPMQYVHQHVTLPVEQQDWCGLSAREQKHRLQEYLRVDRRLGIVLSEAPLMRLALIRLSESDYKLIWTFHHALLDGRSYPIVLEEVFAFYDALCQGKDLQLEQPPSYRDYIQWLKPEHSPAEGFFRSFLQGFSAPTPLVVDRATNNNDQEERGFPEQEIRLSQAVTSGLQSLAKLHQLTLNTLVQGAWALLLSRYSGEADVVFGATRACRKSSVAGAESMVGLLINTLPVRVSVSPELPLLPWLKELRATWIALRDYEHTPLVKIQGWSDIPGGTPLFDSLVVFENYLLNSKLRSLGGRWENLEVQMVEQTNYPLTLVGYSEPELLLKIKYDSLRFDDATIARMLGHIQTLLESMVANPWQCLGELPLLTASERLKMLMEWNNTRAYYPKDLCIHQLFETQVKLTPNGVAVVFKNEQLSYRELNCRANQLAHHLQGLNVGPEVLVGLCMERSLEMVVGLLGILKAGGAYLPLDPAYPKERLEFMLQDAQVSVLLTQQQLVEALPEHRAHVVCLDTGWEAIARESEENAKSQVVADNLAYVIYTSGSTGQPKGVMLTHQVICNQIFWRQTAFHLTEADRVLQTIPLSCDPSVWQVLGTLLAGAQLILAPPGAHQDSVQLVKLIAKHQITTLDFVASMLKIFLEEEFLDRCKSLKRVFCGGEPLPVEVCDRFFARMEANLYNQYGPTEACIDTTSWTCKRGSHQKIVPIGRPIANKQVYLLDSHLQPVPVGVPGELHIGGGLARGYLNRPELTAEKFIRNCFSDEPGARLYKTGDLGRYLPDGNIEFLGRIDNQVKIRGFRIEVGEIEAMLGQHPAVRETVVMAREDVLGDQRLVAYVVPNREQVITTSKLSSFLKQKLPNYMVPTAFVMLDALPLTPNGKVDRRALPVPNQARPDLESAYPLEYVAPRDPVELELTKIWSEVLGIEPIGVSDNFFDLGGHSLKALRVFTQIEKRFGKKLPLATLFQAPTVEQLARILHEEELSSLWELLVAIQIDGDKPPLFCIHGADGNVLFFQKLARYLGIDQPVYGLQAQGLDGKQAPHTRVEDMATEYIRQIRTVQPEGPYLLAGFSTGGVVAFEMAQQLYAQGQKVAMLALFDTYCPVYYKPKSFSDWVSQHLGNLLQLEPKQKLTYFVAGTKHRVYRIAHEFYQGIGRSLPQTHQKSTQRHIFIANKQAATENQLYRAQIQAVIDYVPQVYSGRVTFFRSYEQPWWLANDLQSGWGGLAAGGMEIHQVPGDHVSIIKANVAVLAQKLRACLDSAHVGN